MKEKSRLTLNSIAVISGSLLFFIMGKFSLTEILEIKRFSQFILIIPIIFLCINILTKPKKKIVNPYSIFALLSLIAGIINGVNILNSAVAAFSLFMLIALSNSSTKYILHSAKTIVILAALFSLLGISHFFILLFNPDFAVYGQVFMTTEGINVKEFHPYILFGLVDGSSYSLFGLPITRIRSFATEPSITILYFFFPLCLALLLGGKFWTMTAIPIGLFCLLTLSGMIFFAYAISTLIFILLTTQGFSWTIKSLLALTTVILFTIITGETEIYFKIINNLIPFADFLDKTRSFDARSQSISRTYELALRSPFGSSSPPDAPAPIFINAALISGWLGSIAILLILKQHIITLKKYLLLKKKNLASRISASLLLSGLFVTSTVSDYGMTSYAGLIILFLIYRVLKEHSANQSIENKTANYF